jgi:hypothetical protein
MLGDTVSGAPDIRHADPFIAYMEMIDLQRKVVALAETTANAVPEGNRSQWRNIANIERSRMFALERDLSKQTATTIDGIVAKLELGREEIEKADQAEIKRPESTRVLLALRELKSTRSNHVRALAQLRGAARSILRRAHEEKRLRTLTRLETTIVFAANDLLRIARRGRFENERSEQK